MATTLARKFHGYIDARVASQAVPGVIAQKHIVALDLKLLYTFSSHFHPYVAGLVRRLLETSLRGLQAADTEYETPVRLSVQATATSDDGAAVTLPVQTLLRLPDGTRLCLGDGTVVRLAGFRIVTEPESAPNDDATVTLPNDATVTLPALTAARLLDGTRVRLTTEASATLPDGKPRPALYEELFLPTQYKPVDSSPSSDATHGVFVERPYPVKDLDFTPRGAYAVYNWELFYHAPLTIAMHLSKNQRFEEAQRWFHYVFDPTDDSEQATPERFWKVKPFQYTDVKMIEDILVNLSSGQDEELRKDTVDSIEAWKDAPFRPHVVARYRQSAYMFKAVMAYLDNLIAWGDSLFRQDTGETLNEATQLYVLAANILGPRPQLVPKKGSIRPQTYASLRPVLSEFGDALVEMETDIPFDIYPHPDGASASDGLSTMRSFGCALYFCVPANDKLLGYWDTIADRLFKLRNSLNIQGVFRQLPLFEPPIDPALLARAAAAGLDVGAIVSGLNQPLPLVRYQFLVQKAAEICQEVSALGANLLSTIEKEDNEALAFLRAKHERLILGLAEVVRYSQWQDAIKAREGLEKSLATAVQRYIYYERLLGREESEIKVPDLEALDLQELAKMRKAFRTSEQELTPRKIDVDIAPDSETTGEGKKISSYEATELNLLEEARALQSTSSTIELVAAYLSLIPQFDAKGEPLGVGAATGFGGVQLSKMSSMMASVVRMGADELIYEANKAAKIGSYARREQEWAYQSNLAAFEITQIFKQLRAAQIREAIAEREWTNHQQQIRNAEEIEHFLSGEATAIGDAKHTKTSTQALYTWMRREVKGLYAQCFQLAFDVAKKAERALQHELGDSNLTFLQYGYLAGKEGLLAGEKLHFDIKRMEMAYHDLNRREYELTKHISLLQVAPEELLRLRMTGRCEVWLPEELFDFDCPGHYFRRIKSVALSIPCVTGPYTSVNCTLRLTKSTIRKSALLDDGYTRGQNGDDARFDDHYGSAQAIVTSTGQNDGGLFEANLRDERYLPFEGWGVESQWQLELSSDPSAKDPCQFDYDTIADVILHFRYTAREGGAQLRSAALENLKSKIEDATVSGSVRVFSVRHDFPTEWAIFKALPPGNAGAFVPLTLEFRQEHYPFWTCGRTGTVEEARLFARAANAVTIGDRAEAANRMEDALAKDTSLGGLWVGKLTKVPLPSAPTGKLTLYFSDNKMADLFLAVRVSWGSS
jgi:hypothetical protein